MMRIPKIQTVLRSSNEMATGDELGLGVQVLVKMLLMISARGLLHRSPFCFRFLQRRRRITRQQKTTWRSSSTRRTTAAPSPMNELQLTTYNNLMKLTETEQFFYYTDQILNDTKYRIFLYNNPGLIRYDTWKKRICPRSAWHYLSNVLESSWQ